MRPACYPLTKEEGKKYNLKKIDFRRLPVGGGFLSTNGAELLVTTNGTIGWAEIRIHQWDSDEKKTIRTRRVKNLSEKEFRIITPSGDGFLLDWSGKANRR
jgi:hypothetical protein